MLRRFFFFLLLATILSGCGATSEKRQEELRGTMDVLMRPQPPVVTRIIPITATPRPTMTIMPLPAYIGTPYLADSLLEQAVAGALAGLGANFEVAFFTRGPGGQPIVWVQDLRNPSKLLCGAPLHFTGLGSLLVLSSNTLYESLNRTGAASKNQGCLVISLEQGKEQARQVLGRLQAYFAARVDSLSFTSSQELEAYASRRQAEHQGKPYEQELDAALILLDYNDRSNISIPLAQRSGGGADPRTNWQWRLTANPVQVKGSDVKHVSLGFARTVEVASNQGLLAFAGPRLALALQNAPAVSLYKTSPLTQQEMLAGRLGYDFWQVGLFALGRAAGLVTVAPAMLDDYQASNPYFAPLLALSGFPAAQQYTEAPDWTTFSTFVGGRGSSLDFTVADKIITRARNYVKDSYLQFVMFEDK